ncbi:MAG: hypothetical protein GX130_14045 [Candidatus Hydrogenedens sp.]|jgi:hypothetical protein|nr:hypothetical protein [Candidatus Hydrogenedens sp.]
MDDKTRARLKPIADKMIDALRRKGFFPFDGYPFIPELIPHRKPIVTAAINDAYDRIETTGDLDFEYHAELFTFVYWRSVNIFWDWHISSDGNIAKDRVIGKPGDDEHHLTMPPEMMRDLKALPDVGLIIGAYIEVWPPHSETLYKEGIGLMHMLHRSLEVTYDTGISKCLQRFGYRR